MKYILTLGLLACLAAAQAQPLRTTIAVQVAQGQPEGNEVALYDVDGGMPAQLATAQLLNNRAVLQATVPAAGVYAISIGQNFVVFVVVQDTASFALSADVSRDGFDGSSFYRSAVNTVFVQYMRETRDVINTIQALREQLRTQTGNAGLQHKLDSLALVNHNLHAQQAGRNDILGVIGRLYAFEPYDAKKHVRFKDELQYFQQNYFGPGALETPSLAYLPMLYDKLYYYIATLVNGMGVGSQQTIAMLEQLRQRMPADARSQRQLQLAAIRVGREADEELYLHYAEAFVSQQPSHPMTQTLVNDINQRSRLRMGNLAPDFGQASPDGKNILLSSLRGRVVLIDFWASWCGPCRAENPNVVRVYNQYKAKGFEILGVSLDQSREAWLKAIEKDKLSWLHVSDLGYWNNAVAKLYGVGSIPFTVLVDREGRIVAKNLRGQALYDKLAQLFGQ